MTWNPSAWKKPPPPALKQALTPMQLEVTQHDATEPPFRNAFWDHHEKGLYVDVVSGEPLFASLHKFESGTGWPSFVQPVDPAFVVEKRDSSHGMTRVEVRSKFGDSHLGHVFDDGPAPTGKRYCINSASLRFVPVSELAAHGYGAYEALFAASSQPIAAATQNQCTVDDAAACSTTFETAILAGGCFWGMEEILRGIPGVVETDVGYAGGNTKDPRYTDVKTGKTGHAEAVRVVFDPQKLSYEKLLVDWFFRMHDPTTKNRQGNDVGTQYRSAIFFTSPEQKTVAEAVKAKVDASKKWPDPVVTEVVAAGPFTPAEDYHQDYLQKNVGGYTCHWLRD